MLKFTYDSVFWLFGRRRFVPSQQELTSEVKQPGCQTVIFMSTDGNSVWHYICKVSLYAVKFKRVWWVLVFTKVLLQEAKTIPLLENAFTSLLSLTGRTAPTHRLSHEVTEIECTPPHEPDWWFILMQLVGPSRPVLGRKASRRWFSRTG